ncbi:RagB/SusD family nutrient uptake outer membrane protein [Polaribacter batillariae]|uniref:RagB/SusD family nutrient uptake outer membrane protein n=2 Tax=Polaribacter batillariae TaxID=2808900 RepID=A0ABX7T321_9FLAO|nr:RagB/SusD family nutrient uptake outer membrane protein [Polaribacter batillariae]
MKNRNLLIITIFLSLCIVSSCDKTLDELPDNRTEIDSQTKIRKLLVSAYPTISPALVAELSSDNVVDQGENHPNGNLLTTEIAYWQDITATGTDDIKNFWEASYKAIAHSNEALKAIERLKLENPQIDLSAEKAEALITRAYSHFMLVNIFGMHYNTESSSTDLGVPYITEPETTLNPTYKRNTVAEVYENINADIEEALPLIKDDIYQIPNYHFNTRAAFAFAARFNLYYENWAKAKEYASEALGNNPSAILRDWEEFDSLQLDANILTNTYITSDSNFLNIAYTSQLGVAFGAFRNLGRFSHTKRLADDETVFADNVLTRRVPFLEPAATKYWFTPLVLAISGLDKTLLYKVPYLFEFTDPVARIGFARTSLPSFHADETLLVRAEANILLKNYNAAMDDLNAWSSNFFKDRTTTIDEVDTFYNNIKYSTDEEPTQKKELNPKFSVEAGTQENMLHYLLQSRRILTLHEGFRWYDIKRYGIEVPRYQLTTVTSNYSVTDRLTENDLRKAIQLPQDIIITGLKPNPR